MMYKYLLFIFLGISASAQTLKGTVSDSLGVVPFANVIIKKINEPLLVLQFTKTDEKGTFSLQIKEDPALLFIEVNSFLHETNTLILKNLNKNGEFKLDIFLKQKINQLERVIINRQTPIIVKKDTTIFNPISFLNGTERVVEDLLKKLPGVEIADNGVIKYKGKIIQKLLLDGDDLFGSQYKIGSKNISVDMIDKVQGIEHYENNVLLKGISNSDDVALNLILNKGKSDLSGTINLGYGFSNRLDNSVTAIMVNQKVKAFGLASHNNVGLNNTPYSAESNFRTFESTEGKQSQLLLDQGNFNSILNEKFHRLNNNFFTSGNTLFKVKDNSTFKFSVSYYDDKFTRVNQSNTNFFLNQERFPVSERNKIKKKPRLYDLKMNYSNKEKKNFHWNYIGEVNYYETRVSDLSTNNSVLQDNRVETESLFLLQEFNSTYKVSDSTVFLSKIKYSRNEAPQTLVLMPGTVVDTENSLISSNVSSNFETSYTNLKTSLLSSRKKFKYNLFTEYSNIKSKFRSTLSNELNESLGIIYENKNVYYLNLFSVKPVIVFVHDKFFLKFATNFFYTNLNFKDLISSNENQLKKINITPALNLNYSLNNNNNLTASYLYNAAISEENRLFSGIVQTNYRNFSNNTLALDFLKSHSYNLGYNYNNLYKSTLLGLNFSYNYRPNNYFSNTFVNQDVTINNFFLSSMTSKDYNLSFFGETYYHPFRTTIKLNSSITRSFNKNIVNNSEIRPITGDIIFINLTTRLAITSKISLENNISFLSNSFKSAGVGTKFASLNNQTKLLSRLSEEFNFTATSNIISPDLSMTKKYLFLESTIDYNPRGKTYGASLVAKNLANIKTFETTVVSDFFSSVQSHNLIERYIMLKLFFTF